MSIYLIDIILCVIGILKFRKLWNRRAFIVKIISYWRLDKGNAFFASINHSKLHLLIHFHIEIYSIRPLGSYPNFSMTIKTLFLIYEHISALNYNFPRILTHPFPPKRTPTKPRNYHTLNWLLIDNNLSPI